MSLSVQDLICLAETTTKLSQKVSCFSILGSLKKSNFENPDLAKMGKMGKRSLNLSFYCLGLLGSLVSLKG